MTVWIWMGNLLGWPVIQLSISFVAVRLPARLFAEEDWMTAPRRWERGGQIYREWLGARRWKLWLPDGASWMGGFAKKRLNFRDQAYLAQFVLETRRAELAHWCMLLCLPIFFFWNPPWAWGMMTVYALAANLPCIVAQRYNRMTLERVTRSRQRALSVR